MVSRKYNTYQEELDSLLRRFGMGGETAFYVLAYHYFICYKERLEIPIDVTEKWHNAYQNIENEGRILLFLDELVLNDPNGHALADWYQFFIGRRFREASGKFFTPKPIAHAMARMLPPTPNAIVMDPTCGSSTFLMELAQLWGDYPCTLVANDIEASLVELSMLTLDLATPLQYRKHFICSDIYAPSHNLQHWFNQVDYILANPPFSLQIGYEQFNSPLFTSGYRNSDALFIDVAAQLLKPGGRLVCILPHSIIANKEFADFRTIVEQSLTLVGVVSLPEGVFYLSAGTTTRADIVILEKTRPTGSQKHFFAATPSVGVRLSGNEEQALQNHLEALLANASVKATLRI